WRSSWPYVLSPIGWNSGLTHPSGLAAETAPACLMCRGIVNGYPPRAHSEKRACCASERTPRARSNRPGCAQAGTLFGTIAQLAEDRVGVLADGGHGTDARLEIRVRRRRTQHRDRSDRRAHLGPAA